MGTGQAEARRQEGALVSEALEAHRRLGEEEAEAGEKWGTLRASGSSFRLVLSWEPGGGVGLCSFCSFF